MIPRTITVNSVSVGATQIEQLSAEAAADAGFDAGVEIRRFRVPATATTVRQGSQRGFRHGDTVVWNAGGADNIYRLESVEQTPRWVDLFAGRAN